jgi:putative membrane protein
LRRWQRTLHSTGALPNADAVRTVRRLIMFESHLLPVIAVLAVFWARGW